MLFAFVVGDWIELTGSTKSPGAILDGRRAGPGARFAITRPRQSRATFVATALIPLLFQGLQEVEWMI